MSAIGSARNGESSTIYYSKLYIIIISKYAPGCSLLLSLKLLIQDYSANTECFSQHLSMLADCGEPLNVTPSFLDDNKTDRVFNAIKMSYSPDSKYVVAIFHALDESRSTLLNCTSSGVSNTSDCKPVDKVHINGSELVSPVSSMSLESVKGSQMKTSREEGGEVTHNELERLRGEVNSLQKESKVLKDGVTRLEGEN